jgi:predicted O-methyltransferase YrrM
VSEFTQKVKPLIADVPGWLTDEEGAALYELAKRCDGRGVIVEIGSWKGKSTIWLASGSRRGAGVKVYAIDPHTAESDNLATQSAVPTFAEFTENVRAAGVDDLVVPLVATSAEAARDFDRPVELIFIDGAHDYPSVALDLELWFPKVVDGGTIAFHDTVAWEGPRRLVAERLFRGRWARHARFVDSTTLAEKVACNSVGDRLRNRYVLALKHICDAGSRLRVPQPMRATGRRILERLF